TRFGGFPPGTYFDGERQLTIRDDLGCWNEKGNLSGSGSPIDRDLAVLTTEGGVSLSAAARMGSTVPAIELGLATKKGRLAPGFDIAGTRIAAAIVDHGGTVLARDRGPVDPTSNDAGLDSIFAVVDRLLETHPNLRQRVAGIGAGVPGSIDWRTGTMGGATN